MSRALFQWIGLCSLISGLVLFAAMHNPTTFADGATINVNQTPDLMMMLEREEQRDAMLHLSSPVKQAILEAGHGSRIAFIEDVIMKTMPKARLLIIRVGLVPKSNKSWESIIHNEFVVASGINKILTVYRLSDTIISRDELLEKWTSDSNYQLPVGKGLTKLYEAKSVP